ncbi:amidohydrolase family protein [Dactylonectria macrodidyma]|uniref:Amidohydrolase family protein n=1 Tax=Dactylonectria macrodidyma TaxID=307937 RepID=A0A9P9JN99_9HYPO|nr:amidohydrolase family protein [Dactylonectria macrodidyma]
MMASGTTPITLLFTNGRILAKADVGFEAQPTFAESMLVKDGIISDIGSAKDLSAKYQQDGGISTQDLEGQTVLPGFIDGHMHLLLLGQSLQKVVLDECKSFDEIKDTLRSYARKNPNEPRILARGWMLDLTPNGVNTAMLDDIDPRPIYINSMDLHSIWCSSSALAEMGVADMPDPVGGTIGRDENGKLTGLLSEGAAVGIAWPFLSDAMSKKEKVDCIGSALDVYTASGYTGLVEMAMDETSWDALLTLRTERPDLAMRTTAYWLVLPDSEAACLKQVDRAVELKKQYNKDNSPDLCITGIKLICDGTIDACTAHVSRPYANGESPDPLWNKDLLEAVVKHAVASGLQIAFHAIGDAAIRMAVDAVEAYAAPGSRHRIEHLEFSAPEDAKRLGALGITASIQPVHCDPVLLRDWPRLIGSHRCERAMAYREFADNGALLAIGSDSPTAPYNPLHNLYTATTRRSAREPESLNTVNEHFRLGVCEAVSAATLGAAKSVFAEDRVGSLDVGKIADFVVVGMEWDAKSLLKAEVKETWFGGKRVWRK